MKFKLRPKKGVKVPYPMSQRMLSEDGEEVSRSSYWLRRIKDGDVEEVLEPKAKASNKKSRSTKKMEVES